MLAAPARDASARVKTVTGVGGMSAAYLDRPATAAGRSSMVEAPCGRLTNSRGNDSSSMAAVFTRAAAGGAGAAPEPAPAPRSRLAREQPVGGRGMLIAPAPGMA